MCKDTTIGFKEGDAGISIISTNLIQREDTRHYFNRGVLSARLGPFRFECIRNSWTHADWYLHRLI